MSELILTYLEHQDLLSELRISLRQQIAHDQVALDGDEHWSAAIPQLIRLLGADGIIVEPFVMAWKLMYCLSSHLDHLQDSDPDNSPLVAASSTLALRYNSALSCYVLATSLLQQLSAEHSEPRRLLRLNAMWHEAVLRMASGQQRDLALEGATHVALALDAYQDIAEYKTGSTFSLLFGGLSLLAGHEAAVTELVALAGEVYGTLLQYSDDLLDQNDQPNRTLTLPEALSAQLGGEADNYDQLWSYLYGRYYAFVVDALAPLPSAMRQQILQLFRSAFGEPIEAS